MGDRQLKAIIQLMAASITQCQQLIYFAYADKQFASEFRSLHEMLKMLDITVGDLFKQVMLYPAKKKTFEIEQREGKRPATASMDLFMHLTEELLM